MDSFFCGLLRFCQLADLPANTGHKATIANPPTTKPYWQGGAVRSLEPKWLRGVFNIASAAQKPKEQLDI
eukprot:1619686-Amphidinium_carterae.1